MDSVGIGIHWIDPESGNWSTSIAMRRSLLGYRVDEMQRLRVADIDPKFRSLASLCPNQRAGPRKRLTSSFETTQLKARDGRLLPVEVATAYFHPAGEDSPPRVIAFITDITRRKEPERALLAAPRKRPRRPTWRRVPSLPT
jgi:two-component system sensor histidine kinase/response regulator